MSRCVCVCVRLWFIWSWYTCVSATPSSFWCLCVRCFRNALVVMCYFVFVCLLVCACVCVWYVNASGDAVCLCVCAVFLSTWLWLTQCATILVVWCWILLRGRNALVHLALDYLLCMATALAHPALKFALCVLYMLFVWFCLAALYVPCVWKSMYKFVCFVCDALVHLLFAFVFILCVQGVCCLWRRRGGG